MSKRKYRKGFHVNLKSNKVKPAASVTAEKLKVEKEQFAQVEECKNESNSFSSDFEPIKVQSPASEKNIGFAQKVKSLKQLKKLTREIKSMSKEDLMASINQLENQPSVAPADDMSREDIFALVSFIGAMLVILGTVIVPLVFIGWIAALVFGFLGLKSEKWKWMAVIGVVIGLLMLLLFLVFLILFIAIGASLGVF